MKRNIIFWVCLCCLTGGLSSCFRSWRMNDRQIKKHYASLAHKPTYHNIENDSLKLFVATMGSDTLPPLLLIHGAPGGWYGYLNIMDDTLLQHYYQLIAVDRLGYNHSKHKKQRFVTSIEIHARAAALALSFNHSVKKGTLVGRSFGAPIAAKIAALLPEKFETLVLLASAIDPEKEKFWWFSKPARWGPVRWCLPHRLNVATFEKFAHVEELRKLEKDWAKIQMPTIFVQGGKDWIVDPVNLEYARRQMKHNADAQFIMIPEASHLLSNSHPDLVRQLVLQPKTGKLSTANP